MSIDSHDCAHEIAELIEAISRSVHGDCFAGKLNPAQWAALRYFDRANRFSRNLCAFAAFRCTTRGTASQTVKSLVAKGYVARLKTAGDRRRSELVLTDAGRAMLTRDPCGLLDDAVLALRPEVRGGLVQTLRVLRDDLGRRRGRERFGACTHCGHLRSDTGPEAAEAPHRCMLLDQPLDERDVTKICVNFRMADRPGTVHGPSVG